MMLRGLQVRQISHELEGFIVNGQVAASGNDEEFNGGKGFIPAMMRVCAENKKSSET